MKAITGLIGRDALVEKAVQDVRKGRHVLLTGPVGVGKSAVLEAVIERLERRRGGAASGRPSRPTPMNRPAPGARSRRRPASGGRTAPAP